MADLNIYPNAPQQLGDLLLGGGNPGAPPPAAPTAAPLATGAAGLDPIEAQYLASLAAAPPQGADLAPSGVSTRSRVMAGIADALGRYAAGVSRNPGLATDFLGRIRAEDLAQRVQKQKQATEAAAGAYEAKTRAAQAGLTIHESQKTAEAAATREENRLQSERDFRKMMEENRQAFEKEMGARSDALRRELAAQADATERWRTTQEVNARTAEDKVAQRMEAQKLDTALLGAKQSALAIRDQLPQLLQTMSPEDVYAKYTERLDAAGLPYGSPQRQQAMDYFLLKAGPALNAENDRRVAEANAAKTEAGQRAQRRGILAKERMRPKTPGELLSQRGP